MDTQTIIEAKYGISKRDLHTVPTWAKNERLERTVPLTEMWQMGNADVKKWDKYSLGSLKAIFKGLFRQHIFQAPGEFLSKHHNRLYGQRSGF